MSLIEKIKENQSKKEWILTFIALIIFAIIYIFIWYVSVFKAGGCEGCA